MIRAVLVVMVVAACESRSVSVKADNIDVSVDTAERLKIGSPTEVSVVVNARTIVPLLIIPMPVPYARATLAEKP